MAKKWNSSWNNSDKEEQDEEETTFSSSEENDDEEVVQNKNEAKRKGILAGVGLFLRGASDAFLDSFK